MNGNGKTVNGNGKTVKRNDAENGTENGETVNGIRNFFLTRTVLCSSQMWVYMYVRHCVSVHVLCMCVTCVRSSCLHNYTMYMHILTACFCVQ